MRKFLWEVSLGIPVLVAIFLMLFVFLFGIENLEISNTPAKEFGLFEFVLIIVFAIVFVLTLIIAAAFTTLLWSKVTSRFIGKKYRAYIIHGFYRTPDSGWSHEINRRYVEWVLKKS